MEVFPEWALPMRRTFFFIVRLIGSNQLASNQLANFNWVFMGVREGGREGEKGRDGRLVTKAGLVTMAGGQGEVRQGDRQ
mmetsp:Transcript_10900/g.19722  ORF Transcript_10900/g.19722 Transcript_10900/m.19722 type:complete len:80 (-) Transcript_10900:87-326(-)